jgi:hypothetical protein
VQGRAPERQLFDSLYKHSLALKSTSFVYTVRECRTAPRRSSPRSGSTPSCSPR